MKYSNVLKIIGVLLMAYSVTLLPPLLVSYIYNEHEYSAFIYSFLLVFLSGLVLWQLNKSSRKELRKRDGFLIVFLSWTVLSLFSASPFLLSSSIEMSYINAFFESISGLTTTGATIIPNLDEFPKAILYYRNQLQFIGGMGIIILAVAILPVLGIGGMQLFKAEMTGVSKDNKLTPRIAETAKMLWGIYVSLMLLCIIIYYLVGMDLFDAICYAFGTVSTGGYAPHDASIGYFNSRTIEVISTIFMLLGAINFALHFTAFRDKSLISYIKDPESKIYLMYLLFMFFIVSAGLVLYKHIVAMDFNLEISLSDIINDVLDSYFHIISLSTTTGFVSSGFHFWPGLLPYLIFYLAIIGGCAGSTSGGLKIIRMYLLHKQGAHEIKQLVHPQGRFFIKYGHQILDNKVCNGVWGFMAAYLAIFIFLMLLLIAGGNDFVSAFSAVASGLSNIGPALGDYANNFAYASDFTKAIVSLAMIIGRLEIFTVLVLFSPYFWNDV